MRDEIETGLISQARVVSKLVLTLWCLARTSKVPKTKRGACQNYVPCWVPILIWYLVLGDPKGNYDFDNHFFVHKRLQGFGALKGP